MCPHGTILNTMHELLNWDDVRVFLATMRAPSLRQAARDLGVSRPTAGRRLTELETRLGVQLFDRRSDGLHPTDEAKELVVPAQEVERAMVAMARAVQAVDTEFRGPIRVTVPTMVASDVLMDDFTAFCDRYPQIDLILVGDQELLSLEKREADVAIRLMPCNSTPGDGLVGRRVGTAYVAAYGHNDRCWIGQRGDERDAQWVRRSPFPELPVRGGMSSGEAQRAACMAGMGLAMIPCFLGDGHLPRRSEPVPAADIWVLVHPDLRRTPRLRVFRDEMVKALKAKLPVFEGRGV